MQIVARNLSCMPKSITVGKAGEPARVLDRTATELQVKQEALLNNDRPETQAIAARFQAAATTEPEWHNYNEIYRTSFAAEGMSQ